MQPLRLDRANQRGCAIRWLPEAPARRLALSLPYRVRALCAYDAAACARACRGDPALVLKGVILAAGFHPELQQGVHPVVAWFAGMVVTVARGASGNAC